MSPKLLEFLMFSAFATIIALAGTANAAVPGSSSVVRADPDQNHGNVAVHGDGAKLFFAREYIGGNAMPPTWADFAYSNFDPTTNTVICDGDVLLGSIFDGGHFPTVATFGNTFTVVGKTDMWKSASQQLLAAEYMKSDCSPVSLDGEIHTRVAGFSHSKPHIARDADLPATHLCWTQNTPSGGKDVFSKAKNQSTWLASTLNIVAQSNPTENHCMMAFKGDAEEGWR